VVGRTCCVCGVLGELGVLTVFALAEAGWVGRGMQCVVLTNGGVPGMRVERGAERLERRRMFRPGSHALVVCGRCRDEQMAGE
jgi:hypothetical protein